jgi:hypothetical protein
VIFGPLKLPTIETLDLRLTMKVIDELTPLFCTLSEHGLGLHCEVARYHVKYRKPQRV